MEKRHATIPLLYDKDGSVIRSYGLAFDLPDYLRPAYQTLGFPDLNPETGWMLPIPATYIVSQDGVITDRYVNADYTYRMEPADILAALRRLRG